jgi:hypothetical protein
VLLEEILEALARGRDNGVVQAMNAAA